MPRQKKTATKPAPKKRKAAIKKPARKRKSPAKRPAKAKSPVKQTSPKKRRFKHGTVALRNIRKQQKETKLAFAAAPFERFVREVGQEYAEDLRYSADAIKMIQIYTENVLVDLFRDSIAIAVHCNRQRLFPKDIQLARKIRNERF